MDEVVTTSISVKLVFAGHRTLFSSEILGLENYSRQRASLIERMGDTRNKFSERMDEYTKAEGNHTIFTDDLKTMVYLAETEKELETTISMVRRLADIIIILIITVIHNLLHFLYKLKPFITLSFLMFITLGYHWYLMLLSSSICIAVLPMLSHAVLPKCWSPNTGADALGSGRRSMENWLKEKNSICVYLFLSVQQRS